MKEISTKPYLIRAIYEWCTDSGLTPYLVVAAGKHARVPMEHARDGQIVLNISQSAARNLLIGNDMIQFSARFGGVSRDIEVPMAEVLSIYARENAQGLSFPAEEAAEGDGPEPLDSEGVAPEPPEDRRPAPRSKPDLKIVK